MPIIIMKSDYHPSYNDWARPHAVWRGTMKAAQEWCKAKNTNKRNIRTTYQPVRVKNEGGK